MGFPEKYELIEPVAENETRSFRARDTSTGQTVMVHQLLAGTNRISLLELVLRTRMSAAAGSAPRILDLGEHEGVPFVVTVEVAQFRSLREWLQAAQQAPAAGTGQLDPFGRAGAWRAPGGLEEAPPVQVAAPPPPPPPRPAPAWNPPPAPAPMPAREPGEFTQLYRSVMAEAPPKPQRPEPAPPPVIPRPVEPPPAAPPSEPSEFMRMFGERPAAGSPPPPAPAPPVPEPLPASSGGPGEFTRMFKASGVHPVAPIPAAHEPVPSAPPSPPPAAAGEFDRMFEQPVAPPQPDAALPAPPPAQGPGEFTRMFQPPLAPQPEPVNLPLPPLAAPAGGLETGGFRTPEPAPGGLPASSTGGFTAPPIAPSPAAGPGEFTRIFGPETPNASPAPAGYVGPRVGGATDMFSAPSPPPPTPRPAGTGPGEFTRVIGGPLPGAQPPAPVAVAPSPVAKPRRSGGSSYTPLFVILGFLLMAAVLLIVFFALRK